MPKPSARLKAYLEEKDKYKAFLCGEGSNKAEHSASIHKMAKYIRDWEEGWDRMVAKDEKATQNGK